MKTLSVIPLLLTMASLTACETKSNDDSGDTSADTGATLEPLTCAEPTGAWPVQAGSWSTLVEEALSLGCENAAGNGMHVHVGEENPLVLTETEPGCLTADAGGMPMEGTHDGDSIYLRGSIQLEYGICVIQIDAELNGTMTSETSFDYEVWATTTSLDESCEMMVGDTDKHTFPALPCEYGWSGNAWLP